MQDRIEDPDPPEIVIGLRPQLIPIVGKVELDRVTEPVNPLAGLTVIDEVRVDPIFPVRLPGFALRLKSSITNVALVE